MRATLSTHVLDTARGAPAEGIGITLYQIAESRSVIARATTNADGRTDAPLAIALAPGTYELVFSVGAYFARSGASGFYDEIPVRFHVDEHSERYHVPLLLSPWGYSTYRGS